MQRSWETFYLGAASTREAQSHCCNVSKAASGRPDSKFKLSSWTNCSWRNCATDWSAMDWSCVFKDARRIVRLLLDQCRHHQRIHHRSGRHRRQNDGESLTQVLRGARKLLP